MAASRFSLIIALLPSRNMQKWGKMSRFLHYFPTQHGKSGQRHGNVHPVAIHSLPFVIVLSKPCRRIVQALASYCLTSHVVLFICLCCDKNTLLQTKLSPILPVSQIFSLYLQHRSATTAVVRNDFIEKVLLKLSSSLSNSRKVWIWYEDGGNSTTSFDICMP